jgi:hypothetical protein
MEHVRFPRAALSVFLAAATLTAGCGATPQSVPVSSDHASTVSTRATSTPTTFTPTPMVATRGGHGGRGSSGTGSPAGAGALPADWPADLPVPHGDIRGFTGSAGRWTVLILAAGSAAQVRRSTVALYTAAGFTPVSDSVLNKGRRQITLVVENRDHSGTQTNLMIGVTTR